MPRAPCFDPPRAALSRIRIVDRIGSTNSAMLADHGAVEGDWLVALRQDAGRGRHGRRWLAPEGNFSGSTLVQLRPDDPPAPALALAAGLALIEAVEAAAPDRQLALKWPNDLMEGDAKVAGILLERAGDRVVAGFGVNLADAPEVDGRRTGGLGGAMSPQAFAPLVAASFARIVAAWRAASPEAFAQAWLSRAHPIGAALSVHGGPGERIAGSFDGIETDGALRLRLPGGAVEIIRAGDVALGAGPA